MEIFPNAASRIDAHVKFVHTIIEIRWIHRCLQRRNMKQAAFRTDVWAIRAVDLPSSSVSVRPSVVLDQILVWVVRVDWFMGVRLTATFESELHFILLGVRKSLFFV